MWLVAWMLRRNPARVRYGLWLVASWKFVVPFSLLVGLGGLLPRHPVTVVATPGAVYSAVDAVGQPFSETDAVMTRPVVHRVGWMEWAEDSLPLLLAAVWMCGTVSVLVVWLVRWRQVSAAMGRTVSVDAGREAAVLRRLGGGVELRMSQDAMEPGVFGIVRPKLIWPERLSERLDDEHIEAIVAHELEHVRRRDNLTAALHMLVQAAFWFHPMVWWMERHMVEERERACDEAVVEKGGEPEIYAESLLKACRFCVESPMMCVAGISGADLNRRVRSIMTLRAERLGGFGKAMLAALAVVTIAVPMAFGVVRIIPLYGQIIHATGPLPSFEVATVKPAPERPHSVPPSAANAVRYPYMTTMDMVSMAYGIRSDKKSRIVGGPGWVSLDHYGVDARIEEDLAKQIQAMPWDKAQEERSLLMQSLLAERFKLKVHFETRELPVYELVVAKGGPKLKESKPEAAAPDKTKPIGPDSSPEQWLEHLQNGQSVLLMGSPGWRIIGKGMLNDRLLGGIVGAGMVDDRTVVDHTGLKGTYDIVLNWSPAPPANAQPGTADNNDAGPDIVTALQEQLGLKLVPGKAQVEIVVIDHIERPSEN